MRTTYCCELMDRWSQPKLALIYRSKLRTCVGVNTPSNSFVAIRFCPFCGKAFEGIADDLVGMDLHEYLPPPVIVDNRRIVKARAKREEPA